MLGLSFSLVCKRELRGENGQDPVWTGYMMVRFKKGTGYDDAGRVCEGLWTKDGGERYGVFTGGVDGGADGRYESGAVWAGVWLLPGEPERRFVKEFKTFQNCSTIEIQKKKKTKTQEHNGKSIKKKNK